MQLKKKLFSNLLHGKSFTRKNGKNFAVRIQTLDSTNNSTNLLLIYLLTGSHHPLIMIF